MVRAYRKLASIALQQTIAYRSGFFLGLLGPMFVLSVALVVPLKFCISYMTGLVCFWTQNYFGVSMTRAAVMNLMSGALAPLVFFGHTFRVIAGVLPFQAIASTPALIFLGKA